MGCGCDVLLGRNRDAKPAPLYYLLLRVFLSSCLHVFVSKLNVGRARTLKRPNVRPPESRESEVGSRGSSNIPSSGSESGVVQERVVQEKTGKDRAGL